MVNGYTLKVYWEYFLNFQTTDNRQQTTDNRQQTTDNRQQATGNRQHLIPHT